MSNLEDLFRNLPVPSVRPGYPTRFSVINVPGFPRHNIAKDSLERPALLVSPVSDQLHREGVPIQLEHLYVLQNVECTIAHPDGRQEIDYFWVIRCNSEDYILQRYFLQVLASIIMVLGPKPTSEEVLSSVKALVDLFRALSNPSRQSIQGLWGELYVIANAPDPAFLVQVWRQTPEGTFDFSTDGQKLEVKSAVGGVRQHHFSLAQLTCYPNTSIVIASLLMQSSSGGTSLNELIGKVHDRLAEKRKLKIRLNHIVAATLGENWRDSFDYRFDTLYAKSTLRFYDYMAVPSIPQLLPPQVSEVRFRSNLSDAPSLSRKNMYDLGGLFRASCLRG